MYLWLNSFGVYHKYDLKYEQINDIAIFFHEGFFVQ